MRVAWTLLLVAAGGCNNPVYLQETRPLQAMVQPTPPGQMADPNALLSDTDLFVLPVRKPTADEAKARAAEQKTLGLPMPVPWVGERDFAIEIEWTIKNLESTDIKARVTINGGNEFGDYVQSLYVDLTAAPEDQTPPPNVLGGGELTTITANTVLHGVFREDELAEAGLDLEAITRYPAPNVGIDEPFEVLERLSSVSRIGLEGIPATDVTPAMCRYNILLEATGQAVFDYSIRVRENGSPRDKLSTEGTPNLYVSTDAVLPAPAQPMQPMFN